MYFCIYVSPITHTNKEAMVENCSEDMFSLYAWLPHNAAAALSFSNVYGWQQATPTTSTQLLEQPQQPIT